MTAIKEPVAKLPLAVRKNVRDEWENKKGDLEAKVKSLTGEDWKFEVDPLSIYPYAEENSYGNHSLGSCIFNYFEAFVDSLDRFIKEHQEEGKKELNTVCSKHTVSFSMGEKVSYCGCDIQDGILRLMFGPTYLGTNINQVAYELHKVVSAAPQPTGAPSLSYTARHSIKTEYEPVIGETLAKVRKLLQNEAFTFEPNFEKIGEMLRTGKDVRDDWEQNLGSTVYQYFETFASQMQYEKFHEDEMLREGLEEMVPKNVLKLRVVPKMSGYNDILVDDGELIIQTTPSNWGVNTHQASANLMKIL